MNRGTDQERVGVIEHLVPQVGSPGKGAGVPAGSKGIIGNSKLPPTVANTKVRIVENFPTIRGSIKRFSIRNRFRSKSRKAIEEAIIVIDSSVASIVRGDHLVIIFLSRQ